jgi:hypothetical protein
VGVKARRAGSPRGTAARPRWQSGPSLDRGRGFQIRGGIGRGEFSILTVLAAARHSGAATISFGCSDIVAAGLAPAVEEAASKRAAEGETSIASTT